MDWRAAYVAVGSNLESPAARVEEAFEHLSASRHLKVLARSRLYLSEPMGPKNQPDYVNAAVGGLTQASPRELLEELLALERSMGRNRQERWGPRIIDLDLICVVGFAVDEPGLTLPHPGVSTRNFVLYPLADIAPTLTIPGVGRIEDLMRRVGDSGLSVLN